MILSAPFSLLAMIFICYLVIGIGTVIGIVKLFKLYKNEKET